MVLIVNTGSLAVLRAKAAVAAFVSIEMNLHPRETSEEAQHCSHGADGVAIGTAAAPCQESDGEEANQCNDEGGNGPDPHVY